MRRWIAATAMLTLAASLSSGYRPFVAAIGGAFRPFDLAQNVAAAREVSAGRDPYTGEFAAAHAAVLGLPVDEGLPYFPHPPLAAALVRPLASLSLASVASVWFGLSLGLVFLIAALLGEVVSEASATRPDGWSVAGFGLALLVWPPVLYNLEKGQWSILLSVLLLLAWRAMARGHAGGAGSLLGVATALKVFPAALAPYLLVRGAKITAGWAVALAAGVLLPFAWVGFRALTEFVVVSQLNVTYWETWLGVMYSLNGIVARLLIGGPWARPLGYAPGAARLLVAALSGALVTVALRAAWRNRYRHARDDVAFAAFVTLLVLLNPIAMGHNGVLLALPIVLVGRALAGDGRTWVRLSWLGAVALVSIPKETIFRLSPIPVDPMRSVLVVALPFWGALLLFVAAAAVALRVQSLDSTSTDRVRPG